MNSDLEKFLYVVAGGIVSQLIRWIAEHFRDKYKEIKIDTKMSKKVISSSILVKVMPGRSISIMKELIGEPLEYRNEDFDLFSYKKESENEVFTPNIDHSGKQQTFSSYLYKFKNSRIKITSLDDKSINSLTIIPNHDEKLDISDLIWHKVILNKTVFSNELAVWHVFDFMFMTARDFLAMVKISLGNPLYKHFTFFFYGEEVATYRKSKDYKDLIGSKINGICITDFATDDVFHIFDLEGL